ncbi:MAG: hypothetical protein ACJ0O5_05545 [Flavobacteriaceae bacterium]
MLRTKYTLHCHVQIQQSYF